VAEVGQACFLTRPLMFADIPVDAAVRLPSEPELATSPVASPLAASPATLVPGLTRDFIGTELPCLTIGLGSGNSGFAFGRFSAGGLFLLIFKPPLFVSLLAFP